MFICRWGTEDRFSLIMPQTSIFQRSAYKKGGLRMKNFLPRLHNHINSILTIQLAPNYILKNKL